ncbi:hypothetical protein BC826DRAFT_1041257, partial [Russula brevipes]
MSPVTSHSLGVPLPSDFSKLNVSQLKTICKERRITGYSKLGKAALIRKLRELGPSAPSPSSAPSTPLQAQANPLLSKPGSSRSRADVPAIGQSGDASRPPLPPAKLNLVTGTHIVLTSAPDTALPPPVDQPEWQGKRLCPPMSTLDAPVPKRVASETSPSRAHAAPATKKPKLFASESVVVTVAAGTSVCAPNSAHLPGHLGAPGPPPPVSVLSCLSAPPNSRRFKPLIPTCSPSATPCTRKEAQPPSLLHGDKSTMRREIILWHLDFPSHVQPPSLSPITIPPPLVQRKLVQRWAIILSGLSGQERSQCCLVSKLIRYAVYSSSYYQLFRYFSGRRLSLVLQQCGSVLMINFWPYLQQREQEVSERKNAIMNSFLQSAFRGPSDLISSRLWSSPENEKQLTVALRFLLTRLWFALSSGNECRESIRSTWLYDTITDVVEIVEAEIWCVTTRNIISGELQAFHVLEATCEVLGLVAGGTRGDEHLRWDWAGYIEQRKANPNSTSPLCDAMRWADHAEFDRGISRHWLRRTAQMGAHGTALRTIAGRYVLACVVGNSLSGTWMSAPQMAQEFAGLAQRRRTLPVPAARAPNVHLFLPAHHHIESVHLTAAGGRPLHPALAVVQTPAREYYILRDNGMEVGCEEDGVASIWMRIIGCDARGEPVERPEVSFGELKAYIENL